MKFKQFAALALVGALSFSLAACGGKTSDIKTTDSQPAASGSESASSSDAAVSGVATVDWTGYDKLIADIKAETDLAKRVELMHQAEDQLMDTGCIVPLYYYTDIWMQKPEVKKLYVSPYGYKYFAFADLGDKDVFRINQASEPARLDPALNSTVDGACLAIASFSGLYTYGEDNKVKPDLVQDVKVSDDKLTYTFTMKDGLKWSDGSELNAKDFEYSWKRLASPETGADYNYLSEVIKGYPDNLAVSASEDGKTFTVELAAPCAYFFDLCAFPAFFPVKKDVVESAAGYKDASGKISDAGAWALEAGFVSNGPFTLDKWTHKESMVYVKNPNYHRADEVKLERLEFLLSADETASYAAYNTGDLDFVDSVPPDSIKSAKESADFKLVPQLGTYYISFNIKSPLFKDKTAEQAANVRKAISLAIDRDYIVENIGQAEQIPADSFIPPVMSDGNGGEFKNKAYYDAKSVDLDQARKLLESAGYKFGDDGKLSAETPLSFEFLCNVGAHVAIGEAIQSDLSELGIDMTVKSQEWNVFLDARKAGQYDIARNGWIADFNDPINMLEMWTTNSGNNDVQFGR